MGDTENFLEELVNLINKSKEANSKHEDLLNRSNETYSRIAIALTQFQTDSTAVKNSISADASAIAKTANAIDIIKSDFQNQLTSLTKLANSMLREQRIIKQIINKRLWNRIQIAVYTGITMFILIALASPIFTTFNSLQSIFEKNPVVLSISGVVLIVAYHIIYNSFILNISEWWRKRNQS